MSEQQQLKVLLKETISLLCKNGMSFKSNIYIQGLLAITVDENDIFVVQLDETIKEIHDQRERSKEVASMPEEPMLHVSASVEECMNPVCADDVEDALKSDLIQNNFDDADVGINESTSCNESESRVCVKLEPEQDFLTCVASSADSLSEVSREPGENISTCNITLPHGGSSMAMACSSRRQQKRLRRRENMNDGLIQYTVTRESVEYRSKRSKSDVMSEASNSHLSGGEEVDESYSWAADEISAVEMSAAMAAGSVHAGYSGYQHDQSAALGTVLPAIDDSASNGGDYSSLWYHAKDSVGRNKSIHGRRVLATRSICDALIKHIIYPSVFIPALRISAFRIVWSTARVNEAWADIYRLRVACDQLIRTVEGTQFFFSAISVLCSKHRPLNDQPIRPAVSYYWVGNRDLDVLKDISDVVSAGADLSGAWVKPVQAHSGESDVDLLFKKGVRALAGPLFIVLKDYDNTFVMNMIEGCCSRSEESRDSDSKHITQLVVVNPAMVDDLSREYQEFTSHVPQLPLGLQA